ncbi:NAD(P)/FAD-dependent oxidoreductase [Patiriisocius hiemis]|uniref:NADH:ubiquinone reductase (non-electrogenic) n=1 Tax=Patiriisocius hiemis TaxID=3075604 RepID=A0ABU2YEI1_9FLAO|nr:NAD(P)/FAD-dependent oxidoreductase [Constantimarinum sp. W242]MDT0556596.1 NAD(P)/FAD-dependent oxidoreductase [Constantimarinum sp. W242]
MNIPTSSLPRIIVVGGGFAGISFIKKMRKEKVQIVLFDKHNYHTFQPLLYQVSTAGLEPDSIAYPLRKIFRKHKNFHFRLAEVTSINTKDSTIETTIGNLSYDYLVLATGTKTNYFGNKTIEKNSMPMKSVPQALNIRSLVLQNIEEADITEDKEKRLQLLNFVIAGAGPTGVELAGALAEFRKSILAVDYPSLTPQDMQVHLVEGANRVLSAMSEHSSKKAKLYLEKLGVTIHLNTLINGYDGEIVTTVNEDLSFKTKTFIWAAGVTGAPVKGLNAKALAERANRYNVNEFNQVESYKTIFALGDIALMQTGKFPKGHPQVAQPAIQQGEHLAKNIKRIIDNKSLIPFSYFDKGSMATIGRNKAVVDLKKFKFAGPFAWFVWMFIHLFFLVGFRNRVVTFFNWAYNYINYDRAARLIIRPFKRKS